MKREVKRQIKLLTDAALLPRIQAEILDAKTERTRKKWIIRKCEIISRLMDAKRELEKV